MESNDKFFENMNIITRLKHFEEHQLSLDDPYSAEVLNRAQKKIKELEAENTRLKEAIEFVDNWCKAYPIEIFPEPDMKKAHEILKKHGMTLDAIGASNMRHVINGVREEFQKALEE